MLYLSVYVSGLDVFCIVFCVRKAILIRILKEFSNSSYFFAAVRKGVPFCFVVLRVCVCILFLWGREFFN
jgi:hypothetical protein